MIVEKWVKVHAIEREKGKRRLHVCEVLKVDADVKIR